LTVHHSTPNKGTGIKHESPQRIDAEIQGDPNFQVEPPLERTFWLSIPILQSENPLDRNVIYKEQMCRTHFWLFESIVTHE